VRHTFALWQYIDSLLSCWSHVIALIEGKFLTCLAPSIKPKRVKSKQHHESTRQEQRAAARPIESDKIFAVGLDPADDDDDEAAEMLEQAHLLQSRNSARDEVSAPSPDKILVKIRAFIAKVRYIAIHS
jgi:hypothetical protein